MRHESRSTGRLALHALLGTLALSGCGSDDGGGPSAGTGGLYAGTGSVPGGGNASGGNAPGQGGANHGNGGSPSNGSTPGAGNNSGAGSGNGGAGSGNGGAGNGGAGTGGAENTGGSTSSGGSATPAERVDNPFAVGKGYVNPEWKAKASAEPGGSRIADTPTAVWLDRIAAIDGTPNSVSNGPMGLRDHLDAALAQGAAYIQIVIYDLPGRDCSALASNGELGTKELPRYKSEYIDPIAAILADGKYAGLRVVTIVEVDSLPNLVTNLNVAKCAEMKSNGGYVQGVAYALQKLGALPNVYNYLDAGHHGWLGWDNNFGPTAEILAQTAQIAGEQTVAGFITNTANYSALEEPYFDATTMVGSSPARQAKFIDWNPFVDELSFAQALREKLVSLGFDSKIGMLIDTSRNGWGGANRPQGASTSTNVDTFVNESRIDRRIHAGNWCNQSGAGLGERPRANPAPGIDAYVWAKPPGDSDGSSTQVPNNEGKGFDRMCDPTYGGNERNGNSQTGSLPNAPLAGAWFPAQFQELMRNAHPPL